MIWPLRPARPDDAGAMATIHATVAEPGWSASDFAAWLARPDAFASLAEGESGPVAFGLSLVAGDDAEILMIATALRGQRQGAGRAILRALGEETAARGLSRLVLEVARNNLPALGLYRSEGFVEIGVRSGYYRQASGPVDALVLARPVPPRNATR
ncbi:MAG: GNAT family N-acetyltransferase [Alphaproteobacteria bacterium]